MEKAINNSYNSSGNPMLYRIYDLSLLLYLIACFSYQIEDSTSDSIINNITFALNFVASIFLMVYKGKLYADKYIIFYFTLYIYCIFSLFWASETSLFVSVNGSMIKSLFVMNGLSYRLSKHSDQNDIGFLIICAIAYCATLLLLRSDISELGSVRTGEVIGLNPNGFGIRLFFGVVIIILLFKNNSNYTRTKFMRIIAFIILFSFFLLITFSGSRKSFISASFIVFIWYLSKMKPKARIISLTLLILLFIVLYIIIDYGQISLEDNLGVLGKRLDSLLSDYKYNSIDDSSVILRKELAKDAISVFKDNVILGCGVNNFLLYNFEGYYSHNNYLELLSTLGIIGFSLFYYYRLYILYRDFHYLKYSSVYYLYNTVLVFSFCEIGLVTYFFPVYQIFLIYIYRSISIEIDDIKNNLSIPVEKTA